MAPQTCSKYELKGNYAGGLKNTKTKNLRRSYGKQ
jgi:hypothetical protein